MRFLFLPLMVLLAAAGDTPLFQVDHPWARASAGNAKTGAVYLTITGKGPVDRLIGINSPIAESAALHETINDQGVMKMRALPAMFVSPGVTMSMAPGGIHIMLVGLKAPLQPGDTFPLTLVFERARPMTVIVAVQAIGGDHRH